MKKAILLVSFCFLFVSRNVMAAGEDFHLPNPGILPTNPFYVFKVVRDNLVMAITQNSTNRAELLIFNSNKSLAAALELSKQNKDSEAGASLGKSLDFLSQGLKILPALSKEDQQNLDMTILVAIRAHDQLDENIIVKASSTDRPKLVGQFASLSETREQLLKNVLSSAQKR